MGKKAAGSMVAIDIEVLSGFWNTYKIRNTLHKFLRLKEEENVCRASLFREINCVALGSWVDIRLDANQR